MPAPRTSAALCWLLGGAAVTLGYAALCDLACFPALPCLFRELAGFPCPLCGTTAGLQALLHGHAIRALAANPLGVSLVPAGLAAGLLMLGTRAPALSPPRLAGRAFLIGFLVALGANWIYVAAGASG